MHSVQFLANVVGVPFVSKRPVLDPPRGVCHEITALIVTRYSPSIYEVTPSVTGNVPPQPAIIFCHHLQWQMHHLPLTNIPSSHYTSQFFYLPLEVNKYMLK